MRFIAKWIIIYKLFHFGTVTWYIEETASHFLHYINSYYAREGSWLWSVRNRETWIVIYKITKVIWRLRLAVLEFGLEHQFVARSYDDSSDKCSVNITLPLDVRIMGMVALLHRIIWMKTAVSCLICSHTKFNQQPDFALFK